MTTEPTTTKKKRSDAGKPRSNPAAKLAELAMYVDVSLDVLNAIVETGGATAEAIPEMHVMGQLAALKAVKARLG